MHNRDNEQDEVKVKPIYLTYDNTYEDAETVLIEYRLQHPDYEGSIILIPKNMAREVKDEKL